MQRDDLQRGRARHRHRRRRHLCCRLGHRRASGNQRGGRTRPSRRHPRRWTHAQSPRLSGSRRNRPRNRGSFRGRLQAPQGRRPAPDLCRGWLVRGRAAHHQADAALGHRERDGRHPEPPHDLDRDRRWRSLPAVPSPFWLRYRLHNLGLRALSNVVDATNLILLEWGHPIHGFDLARLGGSKVVVRRASEGEKMATLDGVERTFTADDLLICDGDGPVAIAGVMGGLDTEIRDETHDVLIECAYFDPRSIRRTSRRLGLHTDSSHRFERGVDPEAIPRVLASAAALMAELGGGVAATTAIDRVAT
ncbi:MAG: hypothetical protein JRJ64_10380, partial [Deltaproteobacteria bacterium]|nr:hypothetical protein [Deltaproteobacteria bacterium]